MRLLFAPSSFLLRLSCLAALVSTSGALTGCSDSSAPPPVTAQAPAPPVAGQNADLSSLSPASIAPGPAPLRAEEGMTGHLSMDRQADRLLKNDQTTASMAPTALTLDPAPMESAEPAPVRSTEERLDSLEESVSDLRREFDMLLPSIRELIDAGKAARISAASGTPAVTSAPSSVVPEPAPAPVKSPPASASVPEEVKAEHKPIAAPHQSSPDKTAKALVSNPSEIQVTAVRIGTHPDRTRIVLDLSAPAAFQIDLDNAEHLLLVDLSGAAWKGPDSQNVTGKSLVSSWSAQSSHEGKGSTAIFQLSAPAKVLASSKLGPQGPYGHRVMIDLGPEAK